MTEYRLEEHGGDLVVIAPGMTGNKFDGIMATLPAETAKKVIGWKMVAK